jgi:hypothetical protein
VAVPRVRLQDRLLRLVNAPPAVDAWIEALLERHTRAFSRPEFLKAIRALSARYVEQRHTLATRSPLDSAGKRAAFAAFYAPLHFLTTACVVRALGAEAAGAGTIVDVGAGTGPVSAAWALASGGGSEIIGIDRDTWALTESRWNWRALGLTGRTESADLGQRPALERLSRRTPSRPWGVIAGWAVNELAMAGHARVLEAFIAAHRRGASVLVLEPIARIAGSWWDEWGVRFAELGGREDAWRFAEALPPALADLDRSAGFERDELTARTLWLPARSGGVNADGVRDDIPVGR